jgi:hypothetical protein
MYYDIGKEIIISRAKNAYLCLSLVLKTVVHLP